MEYASRTDRFIGQILDGIVAAIPAFLGIFLAAMMDSLSGLFMVAGIAASCWYYFFADGFDNGQSFGKAWVGTRVIDRETRLPCSYGQSFVRNLLLSLLGPIDWIFIFGERHQRLGDMLAGTIVVPAPR
jgi:uncharacterized RDD family membrane protein YckC